MTVQVHHVYYKPSHAMKAGVVMTVKQKVTNHVPVTPVTQDNDQ